MKNVLIGILVICVIALSIVTGNLYGKVQSKESQLAAQEEKIKEMETQNVTSDNENETEKQNTTSDKMNVKFDEDKMKLKAEDVVYESINYYTNYGITIALSENNQVTINTDPHNENYQSIFPKTTKTSIYEEITGFSGNVVEVREMAWGQALMDEPKILFLMEDGSVEYVDLVKMLKNKDYTSSGKIEELSDIVRFEGVSVGMLDDDGTRAGGYMSTLAIDKDGYAYDLGEIEILRKK